MSRGLGRVEREILAVLGPAKWAFSAKELAALVFAAAEPTNSQYTSVRQALASLRRKGLADSPGRRAAWSVATRKQSKRLRIQSSHTREERGLDPYFTCPEAVHALLCLEAEQLPRVIWEPAAGDGAIVRPLRDAGRTVIASDVADYGLAGCMIADYLTADPPPEIEEIVTNPPFRQAADFVRKAITEVPYIALLLRTNFLEGADRLALFEHHPPARIRVSSRRLPMMHRRGWDGPRASSNTAHAWFVWDARAEQKQVLSQFDWKSLA